MVLIPGEERISASLHKTLRRGRFEVRCDSAFGEVMRACAAPRTYADGTWIVEDIVRSYTHLHELGWAHSVEIWDEDKLVGGLYGVAIGQAFFGESMFHRTTDASKIAFAHLTKMLKREKFAILDCQMSTAHLASLGAHEIPRHDYVTEIARLTKERVRPCRWPQDFAKVDWSA